MTSAEGTRARAPRTRGPRTGSNRARSRLTQRQVIDLFAAVGLLLPGVLAFGPVFGAGDGYRAAAIGVAAGLALALLAWWVRWGMLASAAAAAAAYLLIGPVAALPHFAAGGALPTPESLRRLGALIVQSWRDLLTVSVPASDFDGPAVVPFLAGLAAALLTGSAALRWRRYLLALIPAAAFLVVGILWGTKAHPVSTVQGALFAGVALAWGAQRQWLQRLAGGRHVLGQGAGGLPRWRRALAAAAVLVVALGAGVAGAVGLGQRTDRYILRDDVIAPLDGRAFTSPLSRFRALETQQRDTVLFTVTGLATGERVRLAALDSYDGQVYSLSDTSAAFLRVGSRLDPGADAGTPQRLSIEIGDYRGPWLPGGGDLRGVRFSGREQERRSDVYYNATTSTLLTTGALAPGTRYDLDIVPVGIIATPAVADDLAASATSEVMIPPPRDVPEVVAAKATAWTGDKPTAYNQLVALQSSLAAGYFTNDAASGHGYRRILQFLEAETQQGDDEQYAVAMALMALSLGLPARVVVGFYPDQPAPAGKPLAVTGDMGHVWVEVAFQPDRWVTFDPTPPRDRTRPDQQQGSRTGQQPQLQAPPVPPRADLDHPDDSDTGAPRRIPPEDEAQLPVEVFRWSALVGGGIGALALPFLVILGLKGRRRRRRRGYPLLADRASGGWDEVADSARDLGVSVPAGATRREAARVFGAEFPGAPALALAERVDARVFGEAPTEDQVRALWADVDTVLRAMGTTRGRLSRWRARLSLRSLRTR